MTSSPNGSPTKELPRSGVNKSFASGPVQRSLESLGELRPAHGPVLHVLSLANPLSQVPPRARPRLH